MDSLPIPMKPLLALFWLVPVLAQVPAQDARVTRVPDTDTHFTLPAYKTRAQWETRATLLRKQVLTAAGLDPLPPKTPLNAQVFGRITHPDYTIEKVLLETMPGYWLGGNLYRPVGTSGRVPGVVSPHGHWTYGRLEHQPLGSIPARSISLAKQGHVVFAYDMVGYNDTVQTPHAFGSPQEQLWSFGPLGLQLWNSIRAVDFLLSLPEVDPERIAATGASGGGTQTFLLTAVDDRVKVSAPVNMISAIMQGGSPCENAPGLRVDAFNVEIAALMAPRPMLMVSATGDWTRNTPREEYPAMKSIYDLYDKGEMVETVQIDAPHNYNQASREAVYRFFGKHLLGQDRERKESGIRPEKLQDMLALHGRTLPAGALTYEQVFAQWVRMSQQQADAITDSARRRERLALALRSEMPSQVLSVRDGDRIVLGREGKGDRVAVIRQGSGDRVTIVVHPEGALAAQNATSGVASALYLDAFNTGSAKTRRDQSHRHFLTFNLTDDAHRVQDILTAIAFAKQEGAREIRLRGQGDAAIWALFAAAVSPVPVVLETKPENFSGRDDEFVQRFFVPGIQRAGGLRAAESLVR